MNKNVVNVEPYKAITDINYFLKKIELCVNNRKSELLKMQSKEVPIIPKDINLNFENEMKKIPGDSYLYMTILPLLQNAINMCDMLRPSDPISFIANFMLMNKNTVKNLDEIINESPIKKNIENDYDILVPEKEEEKVEEEEKEEEKVEEKKEEKKEEVVEEKKEVVEEKKETSSRPKTKSKATSKASGSSKNK